MVAKEYIFTRFPTAAGADEMEIEELDRSASDLVLSLASSKFSATTVPLLPSEVLLMDFNLFWEEKMTECVLSKYLG